MLPGDPAQRDLWDAFDQVLSLTFEHPCGQELEIAAACVDSGFHQPIVQQFCSDRLRRKASPKMYPIKGAAGQRPIWPRMHSKAKDNRPLWVIGVDAAKEALYARLKITEPGPGFCHFPISDQYDLGYFEQLTAETCRVRYTKGFAHREWTKKAGARNEALEFICLSKQLYRFLEECGGKQDTRRIPQWVKDAPSEIIARCLDAAVKGDGWTQEGRYRTIATISRRLADNYQELFLKTGCASNIRVRPPQPYCIDGRFGTNTRPQYHVSECAV